MRYKKRDALVGNLVKAGSLIRKVKIYLVNCLSVLQPGQIHNKCGTCSLQSAETLKMTKLCGHLVLNYAQSTQGRCSVTTGTSLIQRTSNWSGNLAHCQFMLCSINCP